MEKGHAVIAVQKAISRAMELRRWSMNKLAQELKIHVTSLQRWKEGGTRSYDLEAVTRLFQLAELSLDEEFGLRGNGHNGADPLQLDELLRERLPAVLGQLVLERSLPGAITQQNSPAADQAEGVLEKLRQRSGSDSSTRRSVTK